MKGPGGLERPRREGVVDQRDLRGRITNEIDKDACNEHLNDALARFDRVGIALFGGTISRHNGVFTVQLLSAAEQTSADDGIQHTLKNNRTKKEASELQVSEDGEIDVVVREANDAELAWELGRRPELVEDYGRQGKQEGHRPYHPYSDHCTGPTAENVSLDRVNYSNVSEIRQNRKMGH